MGSEHCEEHPTEQNELDHQQPSQEAVVTVVLERPLENEQPASPSVSGNAGRVLPSESVALRRGAYREARKRYKLYQQNTPTPTPEPTEKLRAAFRSVFRGVRASIREKDIIDIWQALVRERHQERTEGHDVMPMRVMSMPLSSRPDDISSGDDVGDVEDIWLSMRPPSSRRPSRRNSDPEGTTFANANSALLTASMPKMCAKGEEKDPGGSGPPSKRSSIVSRRLQVDLRAEAQKKRRESTLTVASGIPEPQDGPPVTLTAEFAPVDCEPPEVMSTSSGASSCPSSDDEEDEPAAEEFQELQEQQVQLADLPAFPSWEIKKETARRPTILFGGRKVTALQDVIRRASAAARGRALRQSHNHVVEQPQQPRASGRGSRMVPFHAVLVAVGHKVRPSGISSSSHPGLSDLSLCGHWRTGEGEVVKITQDAIIWPDGRESPIHQDGRSAIVIQRGDGCVSASYVGGELVWSDGSTWGRCPSPAVAAPVASPVASPGFPPSVEGARASPRLGEGRAIGTMQVVSRPLLPRRVPLQEPKKEGKCRPGRAMERQLAFGEESRRGSDTSGDEAHYEAVVAEDWCDASDAKACNCELVLAAEVQGAEASVAAAQPAPPSPQQPQPPHLASTACGDEEAEQNSMPSDDSDEEAFLEFELEFDKAFRGSRVLAAPSVKPAPPPGRQEGANSLRSSVITPAEVSMQLNERQDRSPLERAPNRFLSPAGPQPTRRCSVADEEKPWIEVDSVTSTEVPSQKSSPKIRKPSASPRQGAKPLRDLLVSPRKAAHQGSKAIAAPSLPSAAAIAAPSATAQAVDWSHQLPRKSQSQGPTALFTPEELDELLSAVPLRSPGNAPRNGRSTIQQRGQLIQGRACASLAAPKDDVDGSTLRTSSLAPQVVSGSANATKAVGQDFAACTDGEGLPRLRPPAAGERAKASPRSFGRGILPRICKSASPSKDAFGAVVPQSTPPSVATDQVLKKGISPFGEWLRKEIPRNRVTAEAVKEARDRFDQGLDIPNRTPRFLRGSPRFREISHHDKAVQGLLGNMYTLATIGGLSTASTAGAAEWEEGFLEHVL